MFGRKESNESPAVAVAVVEVLVEELLRNLPTLSVDRVDPLDA